MSAVVLAEAQSLLGAWWYVYDAADVAAWAPHFTKDVEYVSRSDSLASRFEAVVSGHYRGREELVAGLGASRMAGIAPLRHFSTNFHLLANAGGDAGFRCYLLVTRVEAEQAVPIATACCTGSLRIEEGALRIAAIHIVFDLTDSAPVALRGNQSGVLRTPPAN
jgi:hypothetical protein